MAKKQPNPVDKHVGARIRLRRMQLGRSQEWLGDALNLTFQQVQKYEKGANRVGGSRMQQIANALEVTPAYFFEGQGGKQRGLATSDADADLLAFASTRTGLSIVQAWPKLRVALQQSIADLVETAAAGA